jgi:hypothetical protein
MTNQSPAEALRPLIEKAFFYCFDAKAKHRAYYTDREVQAAIDEINKVCAAYAATVEREAVQAIDAQISYTLGLSTRQVWDKHPRALASSKEMYLELKLRRTQEYIDGLWDARQVLAALQGPIQGDAPDQSESA